MAKQIGLRGRLDLTSFNQNVQSFMRSINSMNNEVAKVAKESAAGAAQAGKSARLLGVNWERVKDIVTGVLVIDVFRQISRGLKAVVRDALDATAVFQTLQITLEAILARDFAKEWGIPVSQALGQITGKAQELLGWVRKVAVTTPFSVESLAQALAYGQAFGFNVEQSKRLTLATGDFVAGMGLTDQHMSRIIYNFGQMLASGRVLGRELRDLANNFVPIRDITQRLADEAGIPFEEMKEAMKEARVSAQQFIGAFVTLAEEDFAGAMERMARTIRGVQQNISDFVRTLFGLELLGPVMERIAALAADALDRAFSPETIRAFTVLGQTLLAAFNQIAAAVSGSLAPAFAQFRQSLGLSVPTALDLASAILYISTILSGFIDVLGRAISGIARFITNLSKRFDTTFAQIVRNAGSWGAGIIQSLAAGMAGAVSAIINVLSAIARIFTSWLRTSSPPKLLPDLPKWGKEAMESWLKGWTSADFGLFSDIADVVTAFVRSLAYKIPETELVPRILGARSAITQAIQDMRNFGSVTADSIKRITGAIKAASGPLKDFIREAFEFAKVEAIVKAVKKVLEFDIEFNIPTKIFGQTISSLGDLIKLSKRFKGALGDALRSYVKTLDQVRLANERVARAQESLNFTTEKYDKILRSLKKRLDDLRKKEDFSTRIKDIEAAIASGLLTDEERRRLELEKEEIIIQHKINAMEHERDVAEETARGRLEAEEKIAEAAEFALERQRRLVQELADEQLAAAKEQLEVARERVQLQIEENNLVNEQMKLLERLAKEAAGEQFLEIPGLEFEGFMDEFEDSILASKEAIAQAIEDLKNDIEARIRDFINSITEPFKGIGEKLRALLTNFALAFQVAQQSTAVQDFVASVKTFLGDLRTVIENLRIFWEENGPGILAIVRDFFSRLSEVITIGDILGAAGDAIEQFGDFLVLMSEKLIEHGPGIQESLQGWVNWVFEEGIPRLSEFGKTVKEDILPAIGTFFNYLIQNAPTIIAILTAIGTAFLAVRPALFILAGLSKASFALLPIIFVFQTLSGVIGSLAGVLGSIAGAIGPILGTIGAVISANLAPIVALIIPIIGVILAFKDNVLGLRDLFVESFKAMGKSLKPVLKPLQDAFKRLVPSFKELLKALAPIGRFLVDVLKGIGTIILGIVVPAITILLSILTGLIRGLATGLTYFLDGLRVVFQGVARFINGVVEFIRGIWNIIAGLFTGDIGRIQEGLQQALSGISDAFLGAFQAIVGVITSVLGSIWGFIEGFVIGVIDFFANLLEAFDLTSDVSKVLNDLSAAISGKFNEIIDSFNTWITNIGESVRERLSEMWTLGTEIMQNLIDGIREKVFGPTGIIERVKHYIELVILRAKLLYYKYKLLGTEFIENLIEGIREKVEGALGLYERFKGFIETTIEKAGELKDEVIQAGKDFVAGFIEGIWAKATDLYNAVANLIKNALGKGEQAAEADSPSKKTREWGHDWVDGIILGLQDRTPALHQMMQRAVEGALGLSSDMKLDFTDFIDNVDALSNLGTDINLNNLFGSTNGASSLLTQPSPSQTSIQNINVEVNPTYAEQQSEASIYYDVRAALAHVSR